MTEESGPPRLRASKPLSALILTALLAPCGVHHGTAATLIVNNTSASGPGSLQQAILDANALSGLDTIIFQIPGSGVRTISPTNALPAIFDPVVIDGTTQPGYAASPLIEINGANAGDSVGLRLFAGNSAIRGLAINRFSAQGLRLEGGGSNQLQGCFIGSDPSGTIARGNSLQGIWINGSSGNLIGGTDATNRNVISGNARAGVYLVGGASNIFQGNFIGLTASGTAALANGDNGIYLNIGAGNLIGGTAAGARNVISGNGGSGVYLDGSATSGNLVQGNYIGTDITGTTALRNTGDGVTISKAPGNTIGGAVAGAGNVISGNSQGGVNLIGPGADNNLIQGNLIGTAASGRVALANLYSGITMVSGDSNVIGGTIALARNIVSANKQTGIYVGTGSVGNLVQGNYIGMDATGTNILGNGINGLSIDNAASNTVGGTMSGAGNTISGNTNYGIELFNATATGNKVQGNYIGTDVQGSLARSNKYWGIHIESPGNTIGGVVTGAGNLISGNAQGGIYLEGANAANNIIQGNWIGTSAGGTSGLGNGGAGIWVYNAPGNTIGGPAAGAGNLVSANGNAGVLMHLSGATGNVIQGNTIGTDITGNLALGNHYEGIYVERAPSNTIGGTAPGAGNLISGGNTWGIYLTNASGNTIQGNLVGTKRDGLTGLGNRFHGVECEVGACNNTIGGGSAGNTIAFAQGIYTGVRIRDGSTNNAILGNSIFSNGALGIDLGNTGPKPNVACDAGGGANMGQNYPVLTQAVSGNGTGIRGVLNSRPNSAFVLQFFANAAGDSSGYGEGQLYLGQKTLVTGTSCTSNFVVSLPAQVPVGYVVTATATDSSNNTSEFSAYVPVTSVPVLAIKPQPATHQLALVWTNTATGFVLEQTSSLSPPIQWAAVTNAPVLSNGQFVVTLPAVAGNRFYVLSFQ